jgi:hypothetical protein
LKDAIRVIGLCPVVLVKTKSDGAFQDSLMLLQNSGCKLALWAQSQSAFLTQRERQILIEFVNEFFEGVKKDR